MPLIAAVWLFLEHSFIPGRALMTYQRNNSFQVELSESLSLLGLDIGTWRRFTYRRVGDSKSTAPPKNPLQHGWRVRKATFLEFSVQPRGSVHGQSLLFPPSVNSFYNHGRGLVNLLSFRSFQFLVSFIYFLKLTSSILPSLLELLSIVNVTGSRVINKPLGPFLRGFYIDFIEVGSSTLNMGSTAHSMGWASGSCFSSWLWMQRAKLYRAPPTITSLSWWAAPLSWELK